MNECPLSDEQIMNIEREMFYEPRWPSTAIEAGRAIPKDLAALAEECKALAAQWCSDELALSHNGSAALAPGSLYVAAQKSHDSLNAAIDRLAASPPPSAALAAHNQLLSNALDELIYLVHELECKDNSCDPAVDISDLERLAAAPEELSKKKPAP